MREKEEEPGETGDKLTPVPRILRVLENGGKTRGKTRGKTKKFLKWAIPIIGLIVEIVRIIMKR